MKSNRARLEILLLGPFSVHLAGKPVMEFASDKERALLAYLAANPDQPHRRERLAGLLWPESPERAARASLRNALAHLRRAIGSAHASNAPLESTYQTISFHLEEGCWLDVAVFDRYLQIPAGDSVGDSVDDTELVTNLLQASRLYRGPFMDGFTLAGCPEFEEWLTIQREYYQARAIEALGRLASAYEEQGESDNAIEALRRQVTLEPWLEEGHRRLMDLLASSGQRSEALTQFQICRNLLATELGVPPDDETVALYERIRGEIRLPSVLPSTMANLPAPLTPLVDRERELEELRKLLTAPAVRLVTIVGGGGMGKTRLALALAHDIVERYPDGAAFVSLAALEDTAAVMESVGQALGLTFHAEGSAKDQVIHFLANRCLLLVLDNLEHLLGARGDIADLLRAAPYLTVLCTSRAHLGIQGEQLYALDGLAMPPDHATTAAVLAGSGAVDLFVDHAQRADPAFKLTDKNAAAVASICRMIGGLPLGIILAASWLDILSPHEVATKISAASNQLFDLLETHQQDVPQRHRSLRAITDSTWSMLDEDQQAVFAGLSVFRGGFTDQAAQAVTGVTLVELRRLVAKSCVQSGHDRHGNGRFQIHEYLRQYANARLKTIPMNERTAGERAVGENSVRDRHTAFYLEMLQAAAPKLKGGEQQQTIAAFALESDNIRAAWQWAAEHRQTALLARGLQALCLAYDWQGRSRDGEAACQLAVQQFTAQQFTTPRTIDEERLLVRLYAWQSVFSQVMGHSELADSLRGKAVAMLDALVATGEAVDAERGLVLLEVGINRVYFDDIDVAEQALQESRSAFRTAGDKWGEAKALEVLGFCHHNTGQYATCLDDVHDALAIRRRINDVRGLAYSLMCAGATYARLGQLEKSDKALRESWEHWRACGDPQGLASALSELAALCVLGGKAKEGISYAQETMAILHELGMPMWIAVEQCSDSCDPFLHSGKYAQARRLLTEGLAIARQQDLKWPIGAGLVRLAKLTMTEGDFALAAATLRESIPLLQSIARLDELGDAHITLATCSIYTGKLADAREQLREGQQIGHAINHFATLCHGQVASALLAAAEGNAECTVEHFAAAVNQPFVVNSQWFADIYETSLQCAEATLPPVAAAATLRAR